MKAIKVSKLEDVLKEIKDLPIPDIREVDNGIGPYEYWGAKGFDSQPDGEVEEIEEVKIELQFSDVNLIPNFRMNDFSDWFSDIMCAVNEAREEVELNAKRKVALEAEENNANDYSDIISLSCIVRIETKPNSTEIYKIDFIFEWGDSRM